MIDERGLGCQHRGFSVIAMALGELCRMYKRRLVDTTP